MPVGIRATMHMSEGLKGEGRPQRDRFAPSRSVIPETAFESLRKVPLGEEPAYWPVRVMVELDYLTCGDTSDSRLTQQWAPFRQSMLRVKRAYEVLAYPHVKDDGHRYAMRSDLYRDYDHNDRDHIILEDAELTILKKLAVSADIPFDPQRRAYNYADILPDLHALYKKPGRSLTHGPNKGNGTDDEG
jgi:hypothetical protein